MINFKRILNPQNFKNLRYFSQLRRFRNQILIISIQITVNLKAELRIQGAYLKCKVEYYDCTRVEVRI